jgi:monooxygenase
VNDPDIGEEPVVDFTSGYIVRALHTMPRQGSKTPWRLHQNYIKDLSMMRYGRVDDGAMEFLSHEGLVAQNKLNHKDTKAQKQSQ